MIRKRFLFPIIIIGILSIIACIIIGYSVWILSTTVDTPSKDLTKELIYTIHNAQTVTYNGEMQLPSHEVFGIEDSDLFSINDIIRYEYRLKDSTESYSQIPRENLSNTYTYNINGTTLAPGPLNAGIYDIKIVYDKDRTDLIKEEETEPLTFTIKPKQVEITWTNTVLIYNGVNQSPTPTITNLVVGDTCDIVLSNEECINVGSYEKEVTNITNPNYTIVDCTNLKTNFSIDRKSINNAEVKLNSPYIYIYIYIYI